MSRYEARGLNFSFLLIRVKFFLAQIMTIGPWGINDVLVLLRSLCTIAHLKGIVPRHESCLTFSLAGKSGQPKSSLAGPQ